MPEKADRRPKAGQGTKETGAEGFQIPNTVPRISDHSDFKLSLRQNFPLFKPPPPPYPINNYLQVKVFLAALDEDGHDADKERHTGPGGHPLRDSRHMVPTLPAQLPGHWTNNA